MIKAFLNMVLQLPVWLAALLLLAHQQAHCTQGKILASSGLNQLEGAGGGGLAVWATLSGYDTQDEISASAFLTQVSLRDYKLHVIGASTSFYDTVELSIAKHTFDLSTIGGEIEQQIIGIKYKLYGDALYSKMPQISIGMQHKHLQDSEIAFALGAQDTSAIDVYIAATKIHLDALAGYSGVWSLAARASKANELGLLGFGSLQDNSHELLFEGSAGILLSRHLVVGIEYRQKPDNLGLDEDDWMDAFVTYIPTKSISFTAAWTNLGTIAGAPKQRGLYFSISGQLL